MRPDLLSAGVLTVVMFANLYLSENFSQTYSLQSFQNRASLSAHQLGGEIRKMHIAVPERAYTETDHPMQFIGKFAVGDVVDHVDGGWPARVLWGRATSKQEEMYDVELLDGDCRGEIRILAGDSLVPLSRAA